MSWCWGTTEWGEQKDGTFYFCIPDKDIREQYREDCQYHEEYYGNKDYEHLLLEDMHGNSHYEYTDPVNIMVRCVALKKFDIWKYWRAHTATDPWTCLYNNHHRDAPALALIVGLFPTTKLIADFDTNDSGDITNVNQLWIMPEGWAERALEGETIICPPTPTTSEANSFLNSLAARHTKILYNEKFDNYSIEVIRLVEHDYASLLLPSHMVTSPLEVNGYIRRIFGGYPDFVLTEKGLRATGRTLKGTYEYQKEQEEDEDSHTHAE